MLFVCFLFVCLFFGSQVNIQYIGLLNPYTRSLFLEHSELSLLNRRTPEQGEFTHVTHTYFIQKRITYNIQIVTSGWTNSAASCAGALSYTLL